MKILWLEEQSFLVDGEIDGEMGGHTDNEILKNCLKIGKKKIGSKFCEYPVADLLPAWN